MQERGLGGSNTLKEIFFQLLLLSFDEIKFCMFTRVATVLGRIKSRTCQGPSSTLMTFLLNLFHRSFQHSFYGTKSVSNTDVHYTAYSSLVTAISFT